MKPMIIALLLTAIAHMALCAPIHPSSDTFIRRENTQMNNGDAQFLDLSGGSIRIDLLLQYDVTIPQGEEVKSVTLIFPTPLGYATNDPLGTVGTEIAVIQPFVEMTANWDNTPLGTIVAQKEVFPSGATATLPPSVVVGNQVSLRISFTREGFSTQIRYADRTVGWGAIFRITIDVVTGPPEVVEQTNFCSSNTCPESLGCCPDRRQNKMAVCFDKTYYHCPTDDSNTSGERCLCAKTDGCVNNVCYRKDTHHGVQDKFTNNWILCGIADESCNSICFNNSLYNCVNGQLVPK